MVFSVNQWASSCIMTLRTAHGLRGCCRHVCGRGETCFARIVGQVNQVRVKHRCGNHSLSVLLMLSLTLALSSSQVMVLCVGSDGHMAIEPVGHDHCADGTHLCEADAEVHHTDLRPDTAGVRCHGCTDLALAGEICNDPTTSGMSKILSGFLVDGFWLPAGQRTTNNEQPTTIISASPSVPQYYVPLSSVVLQV